MEAVQRYIEDIGWQRIILYGLAIIFLLLFAEYLIIPILIALTIGGALLTRVIRPLRKFGVELATFTTIVAGYASGPVIGGVVGLIAILIQLVLGEYLGIYVLWVVPGYVVAGVLAATLGSGIAQIGLTLAIAMNVIFLLFTALFNPQGLPFFFTYAVGNVAINAFLFSTLGTTVAGMV